MWQTWGLKQVWEEKYKILLWEILGIYPGGVIKSLEFTERVKSGKKN